MSEPLNELETAFWKATAQPDARPELFRLLLEETLLFMRQDGPGVAGTNVRLKEGERIPFVSLRSPKSRFIPIFTSDARVKEMLKIPGPKGNFIVCEMKGRALFYELAGIHSDVVINPGSKLGSMTLPHETVRKFADGRALTPLTPSRETRQRKAVFVQPEDYPTEFLEPLFRFLSGRPEVLAAWLLRMEDSPPEKPEYAFAIVATGNWERLKQDFGIVAASALKPGMEFDVQMSHPEDPAIAAVFAPHPPFYKAPDYQPPTASQPV